MTTKPVKIGSVEIGGGAPLALIAGPCVIESESHALRMAEIIAGVAGELQVPWIFKASYDKANRTSIESYRGPGIEHGLRILSKVREQLGCPVLSDVHSIGEIEQAKDILDIMQIPAFLCRQTDLIHAAVLTGRIVNLKKGQFLSPAEMGQVVAKALAMNGDKIVVTERGTTFGYNNLVADMRSIPILKESGFPVIFDATHSVQLPGGGGDKSGGQREFAPVLARCAIAAGADGIFIETHPRPDSAPSDGPNMIPLADMPSVLKSLHRVFEAVRE